MIISLHRPSRTQLLWCSSAFIPPGYISTYFPKQKIEEISAKLQNSLFDTLSSSGKQYSIISYTTERKPMQISSVRRRCLYDLVVCTKQSITKQCPIPSAYVRLCIFIGHCCYMKFAAAEHELHFVLSWFLNEHRCYKRNITSFYTLCES